MIDAAGLIADAAIMTCFLSTILTTTDAADYSQALVMD
jgi:hypothetical protein